MEGAGRRAHDTTWTHALSKRRRTLVPVSADARMARTLSAGSHRERALRKDGVLSARDVEGSSTALPQPRLTDKHRYTNKNLRYP